MRIHFADVLPGGRRIGTLGHFSREREKCGLGCAAAWEKRPGLRLLRSGKARTLRLQRLTPVFIALP